MKDTPGHQVWPRPRRYRHRSQSTTDLKKRKTLQNKFSPSRKRGATKHIEKMDKSLLRHILTAVGAVLVFLGLGKFTGLIDVLLSNLDGVWDAVITVIGAATAIWGFFKGKQPAKS